MNTKDGWVEIRTGLNGGEQLVVRGAEALTDRGPPARDAASPRWTPRPRAPRSNEGGARGGGGGPERAATAAAAAAAARDAAAKPERAQ